MKKNKTIKLTESEFKSLIKESVKQVLNYGLIKEYIDYNGNDEFILFANELDYSNSPELEQFITNMYDEIEELMDVYITVYYETYEGRPGNYGRYEEPIPPSYHISDYDFHINPKLKDIMNDENLFDKFNKFISDYISDHLYDMTNKLENEDPDDIFY